MTFTKGDTVTTFAGPGTVESAADGMVTVTLEWKLAQGQGATAHFNEASVTPSTSSDADAGSAAMPPTPPVMAVGSRVETFAGPGEVIEMREDGMISVTLDWKLAQGQGATAHFNAESVSLAAALSVAAAAIAASATALEAAEAQKQVDADAAEVDALKLADLEKAYFAEAKAERALKASTLASSEALAASHAEAVTAKKAVAASNHRFDLGSGREKMCSPAEATKWLAKELGDLEATHAAEKDAANKAAAAALEAQVAKVATAKEAAVTQNLATEASKKQAKKSADAYAAVLPKEESAAPAGDGGCCIIA